MSLGIKIFISVAIIAVNEFLRFTYPDYYGFIPSTIIGFISGLFFGTYCRDATENEKELKAWRKKGIDSFLED